MMFSDQYDGDDTMICCRLWRGKDKTGTVLDSKRYKGSLAKTFHFDRFYEESDEFTVREEPSDIQKVLNLLKREGAKSVKELQAVTRYKSRSQFLNEVINRLIQEELIYRDGNPKSPTALIKLKKTVY